MRWYSWSTFGGIGEVMVEPRWISWGPDASVAVLAYDDTLVFCRSQPTFSAFASLPLNVRILVYSCDNKCRMSTTGMLLVVCMDLHYNMLHKYPSVYERSFSLANAELDVKGSRC